MSGQKFKILMVASELSPFAKTGGLADSVSDLSVELLKQGHDVRVVMPRYYNIDRKDKKKRVDPLGVPFGAGEEWCAVYYGQIPHSEVPVYFLDHEQFFGRNGLYGPTPGTSYDDNAQRFIFLSHAAFQLCRMLQWFPDVMHCHDWQTGMVPVYLYTKEQEGDFYEVASVFTAHNLGYQGWFNKEDYSYTTLEWDDFYMSRLEKEGRLNFLQAGLIQADIITTVSPTYAEEIRTPEGGHGLDEIFRRRAGDLYGILNGVDYEEWNPVKDPLIAPNNFSAKDLKGKAKAKKALQSEMGLTLEPKTPIVAMVSRLSQQKGLDILVGEKEFELYEICQKMKLQFIIVGEGEKKYEEKLQNLEKMLPNLKVSIRFSNELAHRVIAGADFFIIPSVYEPCGLTQMYSLRYATLPIVRKVGGLADTVADFNPADGTGTGFTFQELTSRALYDAINSAVTLYKENPKQIIAMQKNAMAQHFGWEESARRYTDAYQAALDRRRGRTDRSW